VPGRLARYMCTDPRLRMLDLPAEFASLSIRALWHVRFDQDPGHRWLRTLLADAVSAAHAATA
jgi:DNA-binding transcriptional LysR family regulator